MPSPDSGPTDELYQWHDRRLALPNGTRIRDVHVEWSAGEDPAGTLVIDLDGAYPTAPDLIRKLTPPTDSEYWIAYLDPGFVEAFVEVGSDVVSPEAIRYTDGDGEVHWLRRCSPALRSEWDSFATMSVIVDGEYRQSVALAVPAARRLLGGFYNDEASVGEAEAPDPVALVEDESGQGATDWVPVRVQDLADRTDRYPHELVPVLAGLGEDPLAELFGDALSMPSVNTSEFGELSSDSINTDSVELDIDSASQANAVTTTSDHTDVDEWDATSWTPLREIDETVTVEPEDVGDEEYSDIEESSASRRRQEDVRQRRYRRNDSETRGRRGRG